MTLTDGSDPSLNLFFSFVSSVVSLVCWLSADFKWNHSTALFLINRYDNSTPDWSASSVLLLLLFQALIRSAHVVLEHRYTYSLNYSLMLNMMQSADLEIRFFLCALCWFLMTGFPTSHLIVLASWGLQRIRTKAKFPVAWTHITRLPTDCWLDGLKTFLVKSSSQLPGSFL